MKWIKHFTDTHRGKSMQLLMDSMGHVGPCCYWILVEMCGAKVSEIMDAKGGEGLVEADFEFNFHARILRQNLRVSYSKVQLFLEQCSTLSLLSYEIDGKSVKIFMPKLLEYLERSRKKDVKRTSRLRQNDVLDLDLDQDTDTDKKKRKSRAPSAAPLPVLAEIWNLHRGSLPKVLKSSSKRTKKANACYAEHSYDEWVLIVQKMAKSKFCCGENSSGWTATFDWLIHPGNSIKVLEGNYDDKGKDKNQDAQVTPENERLWCV